MIVRATGPIAEFPFGMTMSERLYPLGASVMSAVHAPGGSARLAVMPSPISTRRSPWWCATTSPPGSG
jgi:hypothetical protein